MKIQGRRRSAPILDLNDANANEKAKCPELGVNDLVLADVERRLNDERLVWLWDSDDDLLGDEIGMQAPRDDDVLPAILGRWPCLQLGAGVAKDPLYDWNPQRWARIPFMVISTLKWKLLAEAMDSLGQGHQTRKNGVLAEVGAHRTSSMASW